MMGVVDDLLSRQGMNLNERSVFKPLDYPVPTYNHSTL